LAPYDLDRRSIFPGGWQYISTGFSTRSLWHSCASPSDVKKDVQSVGRCTFGNAARADKADRSRT